MMKKCSRCQETKDGNEFGKRTSSKDGLDSRCLKCIRECSQISANKNKIKNSNGITIINKICSTCCKEKSVNDFGTNPKSKDGLRNECKNCRNIKMRRRYADDLTFKENESVRAAIVYIDDRDKILNRSKEWSKNNPEKKVEQRHRRVARLAGQIEFDFPINWIKLLKKTQNNRCAYCSRDNIKLTVEHVLPLSRGGRHCFNNIILACTNCNCSKNSKTIEEWLIHNQNLQVAGITSDTLTVICENLTVLIKNKLVTTLISEEAFLDLVK